mmetsp:Transcript_113688/g.321472  ORF Transcript_113688/g.321472 Transcript_113688/m.321472 type:complete len:287 (-) Transcript_113688:1893-2753(-)
MRFAMAPLLEAMTLSSPRRLSLSSTRKPERPFFVTPRPPLAQVKSPAPLVPLLPGCGAPPLPALPPPSLPLVPLSKVPAGNVVSSTSPMSVLTAEFLRIHFRSLTNVSVVCQSSFWSPGLPLPLTSLVPRAATEAAVPTSRAPTFGTALGCGGGPSAVSGALAGERSASSGAAGAADGVVANDAATKGATADVAVGAMATDATAGAGFCSSCRSGRVPPAFCHGMTDKLGPESSVVGGSLAAVLTVSASGPAATCGGPAPPAGQSWACGDALPCGNGAVALAAWAF